MNSNTKVILITGGSSGIGKSIVSASQGFVCTVQVEIGARDEFCFSFGDFRC
jgi:NADP-dependent 3-hydroxy acid dehydrogenase YdfG